MDDLDARVEISQLRLIKSVFELNTALPSSGEAPVAVAVSLKNNGEFTEDGQRATFLQRLQTMEIDGPAPFKMDVEFAAVFHLDPPPLPLAWPRYVSKIFPRLIFPYLRDHVAELTRLGGFSPLNISQNLFDDEEAALLEASPGENKWIH